MSSNKNDYSKFKLIDNITQDWLFNVGDGISVGDLMYDVGSEVSRPADKLATLSTEALDQAQFAAKFVGVSMEAILSAETNASKRFTVRTTGVGDFNCPSQTFNKGALVGIYSDGANLDPQKVDLVTHPFMAIGTVVKGYTAATTRVRVCWYSRKGYDIGENLAFGLTMFGQQNVGTINALADANSTLIITSALMQSMVPTAARTLTLPKEAQSAALSFIVFNNSGGAFSISVKGSAGGAALGNPVIPQGKIGTCYCDGTSWYVSVSA